MVKKFTIPFASQGDANDIPDALQVDGKVSFTQGFGYDYERPYDDPQAKDIAREDMNGLFKAITSAIGELQTLGASEWSNAVSYPKGAIVYHEKDLYISQVDDNQNTPPQSWVSITSIASDSLKKAANLSDLTNKTTARNNLGLGSSATLNKTDVLGTSSNLVATQKLVNDTKINLESSKQDKLTFVGGGARVMKEGAYGLGDSTFSSRLNPYAYTNQNKFFSNDEVAGLPWGYGLIFAHISSSIRKSTAIVSSGGSNRSDIYFVKSDDGDGVVHKVLTNINTTVDKSGFLRASGSKESFTKDLVTQSTGSSTTSVMSQKAVTDQLNAIKSGHGLGYGQTWVDVTSQRVAGTTYTNNTGKPIFVLVAFPDTDSDGARAKVTVDGTQVFNQHYDARGYAGTSSASFIVPNGSKYIVDNITNANNKIESWLELR